MKKLSIKSPETSVNQHEIVTILNNSDTKDDFLLIASSILCNLKIEFYDYVGEILRLIGFSNVIVSREGDVNCRFDAIIVDKEATIPIEIKSPKEVVEINIKSIEQALENKIVLLSREFYNTRVDTSSFAIAFEYPPDRSGVYELIEDIKNSFGYNIGIIGIGDLLSLAYDVVKLGRKVDKEYLSTLRGKLKYEKVVVK